jgi:hypothetical protein
VKSLALVLCVAGCTKATPIREGAKPDPGPAVAPAVAIPAPPAEAAAPATTTEAAWTDPAVVANLERDCKWEPAKANEGPPESPLACALEFEQSCAPDPCFDADQNTCKPACLKACSTCSSGCTSKCESCKRACKDDACKHDCAASCATCRDSCIREHDRCKSGKCGQAYTACHAKMAERWNKGGCSAACDVLNECQNKCDEAPHTPGACTKKCLAKFEPKCPPPFGEMCLFGARPTGAN